MEEIIVTDVNAEDVDILWPKISDHLQAALDRGQGEYRLEDIHNYLIEGQMRLWILYDREGRLLSSAVCEIHDYPQKRVCTVVLTGGETVDHWAYGMAAIEDWARQNKADAVVAYTRRGIAKLLQQNGFTETYTVVQKELSERRLH